MFEKILQFKSFAKINFNFSKGRKALVTRLIMGKKFLFRIFAIDFKLLTSLVIFKVCL